MSMFLHCCDTHTAFSCECHGAQITEPPEFIKAFVACMQAPLTFAVSQPTGQPGYMVTVRNKNWFSSTEGVLFSFRLLADGVPIKQEAEEGWTQFDIAQIAPQVLLPLPFVIPPFLVHIDCIPHCCGFMFCCTRLKAYS